MEAGVKFTNDFGDINEAFYTSLYKMYDQTLLMLRKQDRLEEFKTRAESIMNDTEDVGWGFHDSIVQAFYDYYADLDTEENEEGNSPG